MSKLKIAVIGIGIGGQIHIERIKVSQDVELTAIIAPNRDHNFQYASKERVPIFTTIEECASKIKLDGIIIASPNQMHERQAKICIELGIPALLEKPITSNLIEGRKLCELIEDRNAKILIGHHRAHNPILKIARETIQAGRLGKLVSFMGSAQFHKPDHYFDTGPWRKIVGGGPIFINLIHEIDSLRRLVGEITQVQAITSNSIRGFDVEDTAAINIVFENGTLGTFILSDAASTAYSWEQTSNENRKYPNYLNLDCYMISGTQGSLSIPTMHLRYVPKKTQASWWTPLEEEIIYVRNEDPIKIQLNHFADVIKGNCNPLVTARDGYRNLLITEAIKKSAEIKKIIIIDDFIMNHT